MGGIYNNKEIKEINDRLNERRIGHGYTSEGEKGKERSVYNKGGSTVGLRVYVAEGGQKEA